MKKTLVMIMAGGQGERLYPLTKEKAKPAVTFGGIYKIIDFTLSNCLNSNIRQIYLLTQYSNATLDKHIRLGWNIFNQELGEFLHNVPPQKVFLDEWYRGTADAIFQNLIILDQERPDDVLILSGDHIYKMDYRKILQYHKSKGSDLTLACVELDIQECKQMGVIQVDADYRVIGFQEKPSSPKPLPSDPTKALASMGVYVFKTEPLVRELIYDAKRDSVHDFGKNIIPRMIRRRKVFAYDFRDESERKSNYWRDVGSLDSYYRTNMELLLEDPPFNLHENKWPIRTYQVQTPPAKIINKTFKETNNTGTIINSIISNGCFIDGGIVKHSILSPFVHIKNESAVEDSILMKGVTVDHHSRIRRAIVDEDIKIPPHFSIGYNLERDKERFVVTKSGIVMVPKASIIV
ncbi:MAG: glucose-1-phosphate adenylyltransferase [Pseudomonadota bacterium]